MKKNKVLKSSSMPVKDIEYVGSLLSQKKYEAAETFSRNLTKKYPDNGLSWNTLGVCLRHTRKLEEALKVLLKALNIMPDDADILYNVGVAYNDLNQFQEAIEYYQKSLKILPSRAEAYSNIGNCYRFIKSDKDAVEAYQKALELQPNYVFASNNLAIVFKEKGELDKAAQTLFNAIQNDPDNPDLYNNFGNILQHQSHLDGATGAYIKAIVLKPEFKEAFNNLLFNLNYHPDKSAEEIFEYYQEYDRRFTAPLIIHRQPYLNDTSTNRKLKIGYVSPDFRSHSVSFFLEPLLANHDKSKVEVYAYAEIYKEDETTQRYKGYVDQWINTINLSDEKLAERIRCDKIDILVDLAGHTSKNRLETFGRKPTPVSLSWLGFGYTTGLSAIDYFICDNIIVPSGYDHIFSEKPWRISNPAFVYRPPIKKIGNTNELPAVKNGYITFGTLSRAVRINQYEIQTWSEILKRIPNSKLIVNSIDYNNKGSCQSLRDRFSAYGISAQQLDFGYGYAPDVMRRIDIGLDCFPHNSGTTLYEMLYMGIPYITLAYRPSVGRIGSAILHGIGKQEWIAQNLNEYVDKVVALASDLDTLANLRSTLRTQMEKSPLMDERGFASKMEKAYARMFAIWASKEEEK